MHRLVRISPFDAQARRHTSFASAFVYPVVDNEINIEIRDEDIRMDVFRASGAGGQHVNKTSSAVRLTHIPSGIVTSSQAERSQHKNKATAMKMLKNRLYQLEADKQAKKKAELDATKADVSFGSQIRSYVFQPYTMVNDHRTELKIPDVQKVMDGGHRSVHRGLPLAVGHAAGERRGVSDHNASGSGSGPAGGDDGNFVQRARREKLDALIERGIAPFAYSFERTHQAADAVALLPDGQQDEGATVRVAGRIVAWRAHGKTTFAHLADDSGRVQLYFKKDLLGEDGVRRARPVRHRRRDRRGRSAVPHAHGRSDGARGAPRTAREVAASAAVRQGGDRSTA